VAGRYELAEELGRSAAGASWRATDAVLHRSVVVELVHPDLVHHPSFAERFGRSTRAVASIEHPGLARLLDAGSDQGVFFVVREDVEGRTLRAILDTQGPLPLPRAIQVTRAVLEALAPIHRLGIVPLALGPEDVVVEPSGRVRVCSAAAGAVAEAGPPLGEVEAQAADGAGRDAADPRPPTVADPRADVKRAAILLFELITGSPPDRTRARARRPAIPRALDPVLRRALSADPDARYASAEAFAAALAQVGDGMSMPGRPMAPGAASARRPSLFRTWLAVPLLVAVLAVGAGVAGLSFGRLELGGPVGIRLREESPSPSPVPRVLSFASDPQTFDPFGDGQENDAGAPLATDGDPSTAWKSENYFDGQLHKPGVGLLFDLGSARTVTGFRLSTPFPGFDFKVSVGSDPSAMAERARGTTYTARDDAPVMLDRPQRGRYVLLWITSVVPVDDGNRAEVAEFRVLGVP
jgi:hypothetical protein